MAEYGSHHATFGGQRPSIFEVIGQENLKAGLRAGFRHLFKFLAENFPEKYRVLFKYFDECYTFIDSIFQYIHLRLKGGLFPETFYGLKRVPDPRLSSLPKSKVLTWVFLSIVFPYLRSQLEVLYKNLCEKKARGSLNQTNFQVKASLIYLKLYPALHFIWEMTILGYYFAYAVGQTEYHSPLFHWSSVKLASLTSEDIIGDIWKQNFSDDNRRYSLLLWSWLNRIVSGVTLSISIGAFSMQFLDWWYNQDGAGSTSLTNLPIPPPPSKWPNDTKEGFCPICQKKRTNDAVLSSSGFVFCYPCIFHFVKGRQSCPVTGYPSSMSQIVKLYRQEI